MIHRPRPGIFEVAFALRGSILPRIMSKLAFLLFVSAGGVVAVKYQPLLFGDLKAIPSTLVGLSLSIFLSFRNNACYARWWEGRQLWGQVSISCRSFARQVAHLDDHERSPLLFGLCGFVGGLAARLRDHGESEAIEQWVPDFNAPHAPNPTDVALCKVGMACADLMERRRIDPIHYSMLETQLSALSHVQGGCERLKTAPIPFAYSLLLHRTAYAYCILLPFALATSLGWWTIPLTLIVGYAFFGLDALGDELGDPFGDDPNDLPLVALVRGVERELLSSAGCKLLPPPIVVKDYVLS